MHNNKPEITQEDILEANRSGVRIWATYIATGFLFIGGALLIT